MLADLIEKGTSQRELHRMSDNVSLCLSCSDEVAVIRRERWEKRSRE